MSLLPVTSLMDLSIGEQSICLMRNYKVSKTKDRAEGKDVSDASAKRALPQRAGRLGPERSHAKRFLPAPRN